MSEVGAVGEWRWWQIVRERGPDMMVRCREDLAKAHGSAKVDGTRAFGGAGYVWAGVVSPEESNLEGQFSVDWDTVVGVFEVSAADVRVWSSARRRGPVSE